MKQNALRRALPSYKRQGGIKRLLQTSIIIIVAVFLSVSVIENVFLRAVAVRSASMEPNIKPGAIFFTSPLVFGKESLITGKTWLDFAVPEHGDIVLIQPPYRVQFSFFQRIIDHLVGFFTFGRLYLHPPTEQRRDWENSLEFRRVIALPGETVYMNDDVFFVKAKSRTDYQSEFKLAKFPYQVKKSINTVSTHDVAFSEQMALLTVPKDSFFVAADNRGDGLDSRYWGLVDVGDLRGQLLFRFWPIQQFGRVP